MNIKRNELNLMIQIINILMKADISEVESIQIDKSTTLFNPSGIEYNDDSDVLTIYDTFGTPWYFSGKRMNLISFKYKEGVK